MEEKASFSISVKDGCVEVSGSEEFVRDQIREFRDVIQQAVKVLGKIETVEPPSNPNPLNKVTPDPSESENNPYPNVIALEEDGVKILKTLPGSNKSTKTRNAALLVLLGRKLMEIDSVPTEEIREVCKIHTCFDSSNFSAHLKAGKEHFILSGRGASQSAKLSHPGEVKAKELASELNNE